MCRTVKTPPKSKSQSESRIGVVIAIAAVGLGVWAWRAWRRGAGTSSPENQRPSRSPSTFPKHVGLAAMLLSGTGVQTAHDTDLSVLFSCCRRHPKNRRQATTRKSPRLRRRKIRRCGQRNGEWLASTACPMIVLSTLCQVAMNTHRVDDFPSDHTTGKPSRPLLGHLLLY